MIFKKQLNVIKGVWKYAMNKGLLSLLYFQVYNIMLHTFRHLNLYLRNDFRTILIHFWESWTVKYDFIKI